MLEALGSRLVSTLVSFSLLLFSSYKGNSPGFSELSIIQSPSYIYLSGQLINAFENDFPVLFSSGEPIEIFFDLSLKSDTETLFSRRYTHSVSFDTFSGVYTLKKGDSQKLFLSQNVEEIIENVARFNFNIPYQNHWGEVKIRIVASLPKVKFASQDKEVDLMMFWRQKKPVLKSQINIRRTV